MSLFFTEFLHRTKNESTVDRSSSGQKQIFFVWIPFFLSVHSGWCSSTHCGINFIRSNKHLHLISNYELNANMSSQMQCGDGKKVPRFPSNYHKSKWQWMKKKRDKNSIKSDIKFEIQNEIVNKVPIRFNQSIRTTRGWI